MSFCQPMTMRRTSCARAQCLGRPIQAQRHSRHAGEVVSHRAHRRDIASSPATGPGRCTIGHHVGILTNRVRPQDLGGEGNVLVADHQVLTDGMALDRIRTGKARARRIASKTLTHVRDALRHDLRQDRGGARPSACGCGQTPAARGHQTQ
jgi:hypothetical protein